MWDGVSVTLGNFHFKLGAADLLITGIAVLVLVRGSEHGLGRDGREGIFVEYGDGHGVGEPDLDS